MTDSLKLKGAIVASGLSRQEIASELGTSLNTLHSKINNKREFRASEIEKLIRLLNLENADIFFTSG